MEQIKIHFYKARAGKIGDKIVGLVSVFSHVELEINGVCYSASNRDGGVRSKVIDTSNKQKWVSFDLKKDIDVNRCLSYFESVKGQKYDWLNIFFSQIFKLNIQSEKKQICSEFVGNCLGLENAYKYSPESLFYELKELNYI
mgnify:CR=1 FL=1